MKERTTARGAPRSALTLEADLILGAAPVAPEIRVLTRDLGGGGLQCESPEPVGAGNVVSLRLDLPGGAPGASGVVVIPATVTRVEGTGPYILALQFLDVGSPAVTTLRRFLFRVRDRARR